jgi:hypothetical protein
MFHLLVMTLAAAAQEAAPVIIPEPHIAGPTAVEFRTLSMPHRNSKPIPLYPDVAIRDVRIDGNTLHVLVANQGRVRTQGSLKVSARVSGNGLDAEAAPVRIDSLPAGQSRWVALSKFSVKAAGHAAPAFALQDAAVVLADVRQQSQMSRAVDRTGQACDPAQGCGMELEEGNNRFAAAGSAIARGRPY